MQTKSMLGDTSKIQLYRTVYQSLFCLRGERIISAVLNRRSTAALPYWAELSWLSRKPLQLLDSLPETESRLLCCVHKPVQIIVIFCHCII
jgi:hypothetical protein